MFNIQRYKEKTAILSVIIINHILMISLFFIILSLFMLFFLHFHSFSLCLRSKRFIFVSNEKKNKVSFSLYFQNFWFLFNFKIHQLLFDKRRTQEEKKSPFAFSLGLISDQIHQENIENTNIFLQFLFFHFLNSQILKKIILHILTIFNQLLFR